MKPIRQIQCLENGNQGKSSSQICMRSHSDDHRQGSAFIYSKDGLFISAISEILASSRRPYRVVRVADTDEFLKGSKESCKPALFVLDAAYMMPKVTLAVKEILVRRPSVGVVLFASDFSLAEAAALVRAGAWGCIPKSQPRESIKNTLHTILELKADVIGIGENAPTSIRPREAALTRRQAQIIDMISIGRSRKQIAFELGLSENTVKAHAYTAYRLLGINDRKSLFPFTA